MSLLPHGVQRERAVATHLRDVLSRHVPRCRSVGPRDGMEEDVLHEQAADTEGGVAAEIEERGDCCAKWGKTTVGGVEAAE